MTRGAVPDKSKPLKHGLSIMKDHTATRESELSEFISSKNVKVKDEGRKLLSQVILSERVRERERDRERERERAVNVQAVCKSIVGTADTTEV